MLCRADSVGVFQVESGPRWRRCPGCGRARSTTSSSRSRSSGPARSRAARCTPTSAGATGGAGHLPAPAARAGAEEDARRAAVPGAAHADGHRRRPASPRPRPTSCARRWAPSAPERMERLQGAALRGHGRARHHRRDRRRDLREARRLRQLRLPREPLGELRLPRLRLVVVQAALPGGVLRRAAQRPADGLLLAAAAADADRGRAARAGPVPPPASPPATTRCATCGRAWTGAGWCRSRQLPAWSRAPGSRSPAWSPTGSGRARLAGSRSSTSRTRPACSTSWSRPGAWARYRRVARTSAALVVRGILQHTSDGVLNLVADKCEQLVVRASPKSRDFR
jgi:hypothetical protein